MLEINYSLRCWRIVLASSFVLSAKPSVTRVAEPRGNSCGVELNFHSRLRRQKQQWVARVSLQRPHRTRGKSMITVHVTFFFIYFCSKISMTPSTLHLGDWKSVFWLRNSTKSFPKWGNLKFNYHRSFWICVWGKLGGKWHSYRGAIVFKNVFRPQLNVKQSFSNSSGLKSVFEKLCFRDGLVWTVGLTVEIKLCFQISPAQCTRGFGGLAINSSLEPDTGWPVQVFYLLPEDGSAFIVALLKGNFFTLSHKIVLDRFQDLF